MTVRMRHPQLETVIDVQESAVPFHGAAGWEVVPEPAPAPEPETTEEKHAPRRRTHKESDH